MTIELTRSRIALVVVVITTVAASVSYAAIPSANGTISACKNDKGALRVIDAEAGQSCPSSQQLLTWNQQGPQGAPGISGYELVARTEQVPATYSTWGLEIHCPAGKKVLGGGFLDTAYSTVVGSRPSYTDGTWQISARRDAGYSGPWTVAGRIVCAYVG